MGRWQGLVQRRHSRVLAVGQGHTTDGSKEAAGHGAAEITTTTGDGRAALAGKPPGLTTRGTAPGNS